MNTMISQECVFLDRIHLFKVNNGNTRALREIFSKLAIKIPKRRHGHRSSVFIVNFELISHVAKVFSLLTLNKYIRSGSL